MLKLDPKNTELLSQKQTVLNQSIETTEEELKELQKAKDEYDKRMAEGTKVNEENYRYLQREIINTQNKLSDLKNETSKMTKFGDWAIKWGENLNKLSEKIDSLGSKLTTSLTAPIAAVATAGITYDAQIEKYETAFKTFLGSAEKAGKAIKNIKDDAKRTPFDTTSLVKANQMLISTGASADDARSDILALGEAVVATGGGNDELVRMSSNLQQIKNAGKATAMDIRQFAYAGIDVYGILADYTGKTTQEVKDMEISYEDLTNALKKASSKGGKYFGAMANSSETLTGQVSALKSEVQEGVGDLTKSLMPVAKKVVAKAREVIKQLDKLSDSEKENIVKIGLLVAAAGPFIKIIGKIGTTVGTTAKGIGTFSQAIGVLKTGGQSASASVNNLAKVLGALTSPAGLATLGIAGVSAAVIYFATKETEAQKKAREFAEEMANSKQALEEYNKSIDETTNANLSHIDSVSRLKDELVTLVDENGKVKKGYESRVSFILNELNEALGTEYKLNGDIIDNYKKLQDEIDTTIEKKKAEIQLNAEEEKYKNAMENQKEAVESLKTAQENLGMSIDEARSKYAELRDIVTNPIKNKAKKYTGIGKDIKELKNLISAYDDAEWQVKDYTDKVKKYEEDYAKFTEGKYSEIGNTIKASTEDWAAKTLEEINKSIGEQGNAMQQYKKIYEDTGNQVALQLSQQAQQNLDNLTQELVKKTQTLNELGPQEIEAWKNIATQSYSSYSEEIAKMAPEMQQKIQDVTGVIAGGTPQMQEKAKELGRKMVEEFDKSADAKQKALNTITGYLKGLSDADKRELLKQAGIENADIVIDELNKGNLSEENGKNILKGLWAGLKNNTWQGKILGVASGLAQAVNKAFTGKDGWDEHSPSKKMKKFAEYYIQPISDVMEKRKNSIVASASRLADKVNSTMTNKLNISLNDYKELQGNLNSKIVDSTKTVFTTPQIVFNVQELDEAKLQQCFNYINRKFGSAY